MLPVLLGEELPSVPKCADSTATPRQGEAQQFVGLPALITRTDRQIIISLDPLNAMFTLLVLSTSMRQQERNPTSRAR